MLQSILEVHFEVLIVFGLTELTFRSQYLIFISQGNILVYYLIMASYSRTMDFLHKKLLQATTKDQEDKIVDWMLAEAKLKQTSKKKSQNISSVRNKPNNTFQSLTISVMQQPLGVEYQQIDQKYQSIQSFCLP